MKTKMKFPKQITSILLCLAMVLSYIPITAFAAEGTCAEGGCTGSYMNGFCSVCDGYEEPELVGSLYEITNAGQLYWFADRVNNGDLSASGQLMNDITVNEKVLDAKGNPVNASSLRMWTPIGKDSTSNFYGDFYGNGYVIRGLYCVMPDGESTEYEAGLFGTSHTSVIQDILIEESYFEGSSAAAFVGWAINSNIINCHSSATVKGYTNAGGIVANAVATTISKSGSTGRTIFSGELYGTLGGVLGKSMLVQGNDFTQVMGCYYNGALKVESTISLNDKGALVGGIKYVRVSDCYYLDTLGDAIGSTANIYDDSDYYFDESTVLPKTRAEFADGTVCDLMGFHPAIDNAWLDTDEACLLCSATSKAHIPVEQIDGEVLLNITPGKYSLPVGVLPTNASCKEIVWTVLSGPATVNGTVLDATALGTIELQATVKNGGAQRNDFSQSYTIQCTQEQTFDISGGSVVIEKYNDTQWKITYGWEVAGTETFIQNADQPVWITGETQQYSITVKSGASPTIGLRDCNILSQDNKAGLEIEPGAMVTLQLNGENKLASSTSAGIAVPEGAELTIMGNGSLVAQTTYLGNAAIGGTVENVNCGTITIYSGTVTADGAGMGAAIGGGIGNDVVGGNGGNITIYGGTVTAISRGYSAGIGGGQSGGAGKIGIHGGTVTVKNTDSAFEGACIGAGHGSSGGSVEITGGMVVATNAGQITGPGIGGDNVAVTISGGTVSAEVNAYSGDTALQGTVVITGGNVKAATATEPTDGKGNKLSLHTLTIMGASADSVIEAIDGVDYGLKDVKLLDNNKLYFYLPENTKIPSVTFDGKTVPDGEGDLIFCDHSFVWNTFMESTCVDQGIEVYQCEICSYHKEVYETILAPGPYPESDHPRKFNLDDTQRYYLSGAKSMTVTFSNETKVFLNFDFIYIYDANGKQIGKTYTGDELAGKTIEITGNAFSVRLTSKAVGKDYYGYSIDSVYAQAPADAEHVDRLPLTEHTYQDGFCTGCGVVEHTHNWTYTKSDNRITVTCDGANCPVTDGGFVTIAAPDSLTYTGSTIEAVVDNKLTIDATVTVVYTGEGLVEGKPVNPGTYVASITLGDATISVEYTITGCPHDSFTNSDCDDCDYVCLHNGEKTYIPNDDGATHKKACKSCGYVENEAEEHSTNAQGDKAATCKAPAYCSLCNSEYGVVDKTNHDSTMDYVNGFCENGCYQPAEPNERGYYEISNGGNLFWFAQMINDGGAGDLVLMCDIDLQSREWTPIGNENYPYTGVMDGNGYEISNLYISKSGAKVGLIGKLSNGGVKDLTVRGTVSVETATSCGMLVGHMEDSALYNCYTYGSVSITNAEKYTTLNGDTLGGVVGWSAHGIVLNCGTEAEVTYNTDNEGGGVYVGGVGGYISAGTETPFCILNCYSQSSITVTLNGGIQGPIYVGGIAGGLSDDAVNNYFCGSITATEASNLSKGYAYGNVLKTITIDSVTYDLYIHRNYAPEGQTAIGTGSVEITHFTPEELSGISGDEALVTRLNDGLEDVANVIGAHSGLITESQWAALFERFGGETCIPRHWMVKDGKPVHCDTQPVDPCCCEACGMTFHKWVEATCTTPKTCDLCEETEGEAPGHKDDDNNGYCDSCTERLSPAILHGRSLSLNGDIAMNFYMDLSDEVLADENAYMEFRKEDGTVIHVPLVEATKKLRNTDNYYVFTIPVTSKEMADVVEAQFFWSEGSTETYTYSVKTYADNTLPTCEDEALKNLLTAMLHYGAAAQTYFGYHTDRLANEGLEAADYSGVNIEGFTAEKGQATKLLSYYGASLQLNSRTAIRFVFLADSSLQEITASCKGETLEWTREGNYISVIVDDISAKDLDESVTLTVSDGTDTMEISYSPMTYCQNVQNGNKAIHTPELKTLVDALFVYNQAANTYFGDN